MKSGHQPAWRNLINCWEIVGGPSRFARSRRTVPVCFLVSGKAGTLRLLTERAMELRPCGEFEIHLRLGAVKSQNGKENASGILNRPVFANAVGFNPLFTVRRSVKGSTVESRADLNENWIASNRSEPGHHQRVTRGACRRFSGAGPARDMEAGWAGAIHALFQNPEGCQRLSERGRSLMEQEYMAENRVKRLEYLYTRLVTRR